MPAQIRLENNLDQLGVEVPAARRSDEGILLALRGAATQPGGMDRRLMDELFPSGSLEVTAARREQMPAPAALTRHRPFEGVKC
ncbi:MAG: hypothetical protein IPG96_07585 [Proteobacteria bacterium]|nr:hypothetical protein [Pseudomonadota bacterium]